MVVVQQQPQMAEMKGRNPFSPFSTPPVIHCPSSLRPIRRCFPTFEALTVARMSSPPHSPRPPPPPLPITHGRGACHATAQSEAWTRMHRASISQLSKRTQHTGLAQPSQSAAICRNQRASETVLSSLGVAHQTSGRQLRTPAAAAFRLRCARAAAALQD